jgi:predicted ATPase/class 3 adenylate cyclase/tetratricopeptide (TPR) repeat protein
MHTADPPPGALAFLFTDIEESTRLWQDAPDAMRTALARHDVILRGGIEALGGWVFKTAGDAFCAAFDEPQRALDAALALQETLLTEAWPRETPIRVRMALHTGVAQWRDGDYFGPPLNVVARLLSVARGGQTLLSSAVRDRVDGTRPQLAEIESHGFYRLKGVEEPVEVFELGLRGRAPFAPPPDTDRVYRVVRTGELWQPVRAIRHNLPAERDAFVGRAAELQAIARRLDAGARFVTVLGSGGTGKTRLVRRYGLMWLGDWPGGVYFVDLSETRSLDGIFFAVASALDVPIGKGDPAVQLGHAIAGRGRCLVILDNFEQVAQHAPATLGHWLDRAADAAFVVTSRERLHVPGEESFPVEPLPLAVDAIDLFAVRARAQNPSFVLGEANRAAVAEVVRLLDGLPLAIELAAARASMLSPIQLVARMRDRFSLLAGARGAASRQATLRAAVDWSWELLSPWEQAALAQFSVFEGGFTLEAAEAVLDLGDWTEAPPAIDVVQALVDKSLLRAWLPKAHPRFDIDEPYFGMYLSIHEYASDKLQAQGADAKTHAQQRHGSWCARFGADDAIVALSTHDGVRRRQALTLEVDNLAAACRRAVERSDPDVAASTYRALWEVLSLKGPFGPGLELGTKVLALQGIEARQRIDTALSLADARLRSGHIDSARELLQGQLAQARAFADRRREGLLMGQLANFDREQGHMDRAKATVEAAIAIHREVDNLLGLGSTLHTLGNLLDEQGSAAPSRESHEAALAIYTRMGHRHGVGQVRASLGILNRHQGRMDEAREHYGAALEIYREVGDRRSEGIVLGNLANLLNDQGFHGEARAHYEAALAIHREVGSRVVEAYALANIALLIDAQGRRDEARACLEQALAIDREVSNRIHEGVVLVNLGGVELADSRFERAQVHLDEGLRINRATGNRLYQGTALSALGEMRRRQQRIAESMAVLQEGEALLRDVDNPVELAHLLCTKGWTAFDAGDSALARAALSEAEGIARGVAATSESELVREIDALREAVDR